MSKTNVTRISERRHSTCLIQVTSHFNDKVLLRVRSREIWPKRKKQYDGGGDGNDAARSRGASTAMRIGKSQERDSPLKPPGEDSPLYLDFDFLVPRAVGEYISIVFSKRTVILMCET